MKISADKTAFCEYFPNGRMRSCTPREQLELHTSCGTLVPKYIRDKDIKRSSPTLTFYRSGKIRTLQTDAKTEISTPAGVYPAVLVIFHEDGSLAHFYTNSDLSTDESDWLTLDLPCGIITAKVLSVSFYESGAIRAVSLAPGEEEGLDTNVGFMQVRNTFSFYENGNIKSAEPAHSIKLVTPVGCMEIYDSTAVAGSTDIGSLQFSRSGEITSFRISNITLDINTPGGSRLTIEPVPKLNDFDNKMIIPQPITIRFDDGSVVITGGRETVMVPISGASFTPVSQRAV